MSPLFRRNSTSTANATQASQPAAEMKSTGKISGVSGHTGTDTRVLIKAAAQEWAQELIAETGVLPLANIDCLGYAKLELTSAHPSGLAQLLVGKPTRLSLLMREKSAFRQALKQLRAATRMASGVSGEEPQSVTLQLAMGVGHWSENITEADASLAAPAETSVEPGAVNKRPPMPTPPIVPGREPAMDETVTSKVGAEESLGTGKTLSSGRTDQDFEENALQTGTTKDFRAPILVREVRVTEPMGQDPTFFSLTDFELNSVFLDALETDGYYLRKQFIEQAAELDGNPRQALDMAQYFAESRFADFDLQDEIFLAALVPPSVAAARDLQLVAETVDEISPFAAVCGSKKAQEAANSRMGEADFTDRDPSRERGVGDIDTRELVAVDYAANGCSFVLDTPKGSRAVTTITSIMVDAAASGRSVLYVGGQLSNAKAVMKELSQLGLGELGLDLIKSGEAQHICKSLRQGLRITSREFDKTAILQMRKELVECRAKLTGYVNAMHISNKAVGMSPFMVLENLAALSAKENGPRTRVRLDDKAIAAMEGPGANDIRDLFVEAAKIGCFTQSVGKSAWKDAVVSDTATAQKALDNAHELLEGLLTPTISRAGVTAQRCGLQAANTMREWGEQVELISNLATSLDIFKPEIFEHSLSNMVAASGNRSWRRERQVEMGMRERRRWRKTAEELLLPLAQAADLHTALLQAQEYSDKWRKLAVSNAGPRLPKGLDTLIEQWQTVSRILAELQEVLPVNGSQMALLDMPFSDLLYRVKIIVKDGAHLRMLPKRNEVLQTLQAAHFGDLIADLQEREVPEEALLDELELARSMALLARSLNHDENLAGLDFADLDKLVIQVRELDKAQVESLAGPILKAVVRRLRKEQNEQREITIALDNSLQTGATTLKELEGKSLELARLAKPITFAPVVQVSQLFSSRPFDLVVLDGLEDVELAQTSAAIARAKQLIVCGDLSQPLAGALKSISAVFPHYRLPILLGHPPQYLASVISEFKGIEAIQPLPDGPTGRHPQLLLVDGRGVTNPATGCVDAPAEEVQAVVAALEEHQRLYANESLAVVTLTGIHAEAIKQALRQRIIQEQSLTNYLASRPGGMDFAVVDMREAHQLERDHVIFSLGLGKTPHGMVLHRFGPLQNEDGLSALLAVVSAAKKAITIVSSLSHQDIDLKRAQGAGVKAIVQLLEFAASDSNRSGRHLHVHKDIDGPKVLDSKEEVQIENPNLPSALKTALYADLLARLEEKQLVVRQGCGPVAFTLASSEYPEEAVVAVLTDDATYACEPSIRWRDRHLAEKLEARGWEVVRLFAITLFVDPLSVSERLYTITRQASAKLHGQTYSPQLETVGLNAGIDKGEDGSEVDKAQQDSQLPQKSEPDQTPNTGSEQVDYSGSLDEPERSECKLETELAAMGTSVKTDLDSPDSEDSPSVEPVELANSLDSVKPLENQVASKSNAFADIDRGPKPSLVLGRPISTYSDDELDDLMLWLAKDGIVRRQSQWVQLLADELQLPRRNVQIDAVLKNVVRRCPLLVARPKHD